MYAALQAEQVLLTDEMKNERTAAIQKKEEEMKEYQKKVFGFEGLLFLKKQELVKPVMDEIWDAVDKVGLEIAPSNEPSKAVAHKLGARFIQLTAVDMGYGNLQQVEYWENDL